MTLRRDSVRNNALSMNAVYTIVILVVDLCQNINTKSDFADFRIVRTM